MPDSNPLILLTAQDAFGPMQAGTQVIESYVRRYPDHWFWLHRRWKQR